MVQMNLFAGQEQRHRRREQTYDYQGRSEEHTSELQSLAYLVCRLLLEKKKEDVVHIYNGILAIKKNDVGSFVEMWMDLEFVIQSEVIQKEKNKYHILTHICGVQKNGTDEPICRAGIETQTQRTDMWTQKGKERAGRTVRLCLT